MRKPTEHYKFEIKIVPSGKAAGIYVFGGYCDGYQYNKKTRMWDTRGARRIAKALREALESGLKIKTR